MATTDGVSAAFSSNDILSEILLRLPPESVFRLIAVSKRWLSFICSSSFLHDYLRLWPEKFHLVGFFVCNTLYLGGPKDGPRRPRTEPALPFLSTCGEGDDLKFSGVLQKLGYFIDSSNGLILCGRHPKTYIVWNPISKHQYQLPHPRVYFEELCMAFVVDGYPSDDMCYKVIRAKCERKCDETKTVYIETFKSKASTWYYSTVTCTSTLSLSPWAVATVIKGVIHWHGAMGNIAIYNPDSGDKKIDMVKLPDSDDYDEHVLGASSDGLLQYGWSCKSGMRIWVLRGEERRSSSACSSKGSFKYNWSLRYRLNFKTMWRKNPTVMKRFSTLGKETQLLSFLPQNSESVFIRCESNIFIYHVASDTVEVVNNDGRGPKILWDFSNVVPYFRPNVPHSSLCGSGNMK